MLKKFMSIVCVGLMSFAFVGCDTNGLDATDSDIDAVDSTMDADSTYDTDATVDGVDADGIDEPLDDADAPAPGN